MFDCSLASVASFFWCVGSVSVCCFGLDVMFFFYCVSVIKQIPENFIGEVSVSVVTMRSLPCYLDTVVVLYLILCCNPGWEL